LFAPNTAQFAERFRQAEFSALRRISILARYRIPGMSALSAPKLAQRLREHPNLEVMMRCLVLLFAALATSACSSGALRSGGVNRALATNGLLAQVEGGGGCRSINERDTYQSHFFPGILFMRGRCRGEHNNVLHATI